MNNINTISKEPARITTAGWHAFSRIFQKKSRFVENIPSLNYYKYAAKAVKKLKEVIFWKK
jgi:hypothetical protein